MFIDDVERGLEDIIEMAANPLSSLCSIGAGSAQLGWDLGNGYMDIRYGFSTEGSRIRRAAHRSTFKKEWNSFWQADGVGKTEKAFGSLGYALGSGGFASAALFPRLGKVVPGAGGLRARSLNNKEARIWYQQQLDKIPSRVDPALSLREQGLQAYAMRNEAKMQARALMKKQAVAATLDPPRSLDKVALTTYQKGYVGDGFWVAIINSSTRTNRQVDSNLGMLNPHDGRMQP